VIGHRLVKLFDKIGKRDKPTVVATIDGMGDKGSCKPSLSGAGRTHKDHVAAFFHVVKAIIQVHDFLFVQLRLPGKRKGLDHVFFRDPGTGHAHLSGVFLFDFILLRNDIFEQARMRIIALLGD